MEGGTDEIGQGDGGGTDIFGFEGNFWVQNSAHSCHKRIRT